MTQIEQLSEDITALRERLAALEAEADIRRIAARYMLLCDKPTADAPGPAFPELFTKDVVWEGTESRYSKWFGRHEGIDNVMTFFKNFRSREQRFVLNVHYIGNESIHVSGDTAEGWWLLYEPVTDATEVSTVLAARLHMTLRREPDAWRICHFRTQNLFHASQPQGWNDDISRRPT